MTDYVRFCPNCKLVYKPDSEIHVKPEIYCPRCGFDLRTANDWKKIGKKDK